MEKIIFLDKPIFSEDEVDQARNEKKKELIPKIEEFVSHHALFKDIEVTISFAKEGKSSLVSIIETEEGKYVLKMTLTDLPEKEGAFLNVWEEDGVSVPHVIEEGVLGKNLYILMSFVNADTLSNTYSGEEMVSRRLFVELGSALSKMHTRNVRDEDLAHDGHPGRAQFPKFATSRLAYIKEHSILNDKEHGSIERAIEIIKQYMATDDRRTYCHNDLAPYNAFATDPVTIFDPSPAFNHPYMDLGMTMVLSASMYDSEDIVPQLIEGYFADKTIDPQVIHAFVVFNSHRRIPRWHMTNRLERIFRMQKYLKNNKGLMDLS